MDVMQDNLKWPAGKYTIQVMARSMGVELNMTLKNMDFIISDTMPATSVDFAANVTSPPSANR
jgi:hypothetical protein